MKIRNLFSRKKTGSKSTSRTPWRSRLTLELLEDRLVPALSFLDQPLSVATGQTLLPIKVHSDAGPNVSVTVALNEQSSGGMPLLGGTVTQKTDASGNATFSDLFVYGGTAKDATLTATAPAPAAGSPLDVTVSSAFQVKPGGDHLNLSGTIPTTAAGASLGTLTVQVLDVNGVLERGDSTTVVQLFLQDNPDKAQFRDAITGDVIDTNKTPITARLVQGVATFTAPSGNPLALDRAGIGYTLGVEATNNGTLLPATSNPFVITAGAPTGLAFLTQPTFTDSNVVTVGKKNDGTDITQDWTINRYNPNTGVPNSWTGVVVGVVDRFGNQVTSGINSGSVTISTTGKFSSNAVTTVPIDPNTGVATFTNLQWNGNIQLPLTADADAGATVLTVLNTGQLFDGQTVVTLNGAAGIPPNSTITKKDATHIILSNPLTALLPENTQLAFNYAGSNLTLTANGTVVTPGGDVVPPPVTSTPFGVAINPRFGLAFVPGFAPPTEARVRTALGPIKVQVVDETGQVVTGDNTDRIVLIADGVTGTLTQPVVNGVATFDDLAIAGQKLILADGTPAPPLTLNFQFQNLALGTLAPKVNLLPGPAYNLSFQNRDVGTTANPIEAGKYIVDNGGKPLAIEIVDRDDNAVTTDNTTVVSIGLLPNEGRGPVFVGNSATIYKPTDPRLEAPTSNLPAVPNSFDFQATARAVNGVVTFPKLYMDFVGGNYILSAGTTSFATHAGADTKPFNVVAAQADHLVFANQVNTTSGRLRLNTFQPIVGLPDLYKNINGLVVAAQDQFGNFATGFNDEVQLTLAGGTADLINSKVKAYNGFAVFNQTYVDGPGTFTVSATSSSKATDPSSSFQINAAPLIPGDPNISIATIGDQQSGKSFQVQVQLLNGDTPTKDLNFANVALELRDAEGHPLQGGQATFTYNSDARPDANGLFTFTCTITLIPPTTKFSFQILGLLDLYGKAVFSNVFRDPVLAGPGSDPSSPAGVVNYGLGSLTTNFDTISSAPVYSSFRPGGQPFPPVVGFDPKVVTGTGKLPALQQPNVASDFDQVPQSSKWWSSLMFPRSKVADTDSVTPQDSQKNQLFALNAAPFTAMVNSNGSFTLTGTFDKGSKTITLKSTDRLSVGATVSGPGIAPRTTITAIDTSDKTITVITVSTATEAASANGGAILTFNTNFAGLGLSYLTDLFVQPSKAFNDPPPPFVPAGQPQAWENPQAPGAERWQYRYDGNGNGRLYQDLAVGLQGVQADGKVLSYSDWTATLAWQGTDLSGRAQELRATLGQGLPFVYFTAPTSTDANGTAIQLVTSPKNNFDTVNDKQVPAQVKVRAYDADGKEVHQGTGAFELEISYELHDVLDEIPQLATITNAGVGATVKVQDTTALAVGMAVTGLGLPDGVQIATIDGSTNTITLTNTAPVTAGTGTLRFNTNFVRSFTHFYGIYLPRDVAWSIVGADENGNTTITARLSSQNYFSVATLPGGTRGTFNTAFNTFLPHAYTFVTGSTSSFNFDPSRGKVTTTYALQTQVMQQGTGSSDTGPFMALNASQYNNLLPSDLEALKRFNPDGNLRYVSPHGELLLWNGPVFHTQLQYTGVLPAVPPLLGGGGPVSGQGGAADLWVNYLLPVLRSVSSQPQGDGRLALNELFPDDNNYLQAQAMYGAAQLVPILLEIAQSTDPGLSASTRAQAAGYAQDLYNQLDSGEDSEQEGMRFPRNRMGLC
jgi:hypothetical protein